MTIGKACRSRTAPEVYRFGGNASASVFISKPPTNFASAQPHNAARLTGRCILRRRLHCVPFHTNHLIRVYILSTRGATYLPIGPYLLVKNGLYLSCAFGAVAVSISDKTVYCVHRLPIHSTPQSLLRAMPIAGGCAV